MAQLRKQYSTAQIRNPLSIPSAEARRRKQKMTRMLFLLPAVCYMAFVYVLPIAYNLLISFQNYSLTTMANGNAEFIGLDNYIKILGNPLMINTIKNTALFVFFSILVQFSAGFALALYFNRRFPLSRFLRMILLLPWLLPLVVAATAFRWILSQTNGVLNEILLSLHLIGEPMGWLVTPGLALFSIILVNIWAGIPFNFVLLYSGLQDIPKDYYEAAKIDGASRIQTFLKITLPSLRHTIAVVLMLGFIYTMQVFDLVLGLTGGGPANSSQILSTLSYSFSFMDSNYGQGAAVGNLMLFVMMLFSLIYLRYGTKEDY
ncbi:carbohydrate ABC transporter permease [Neobacillus muris]|uniref:carbohydrate ABC transporter permease n=1 Tax=Neobacillus muris TaxID=2941334 RepID=UPI00203D0810|nr:sugar ABC transporter permease [Neobacillus muris]